MTARIASTIVVAREDFSIPGAECDAEPADRAERLFALLREHQPDVLLLDLSRAGEPNLSVIAQIRQRCAVPILVACPTGDPRAADYRLAGAVDVIPAPVDVALLSQVIQRIIRVSGEAQAGAPPPLLSPTAFTFGSLSFQPDHNRLVGPDGDPVRLTTAENDVLSMLVSRPRQVCSRRDIAARLYGRYQPNSDRAIDVIVNRLRKKLAAATGPNSEFLIRTEFRRGYALTCDVKAALRPPFVEAMLGAA